MLLIISPKLCCNNPIHSGALRHMSGLLLCAPLLFCRDALYVSKEHPGMGCNTIGHKLPAPAYNRAHVPVAVPESGQYFIQILLEKLS